MKKSVSEGAICRFPPFRPVGQPSAASGSIPNSRHIRQT
jgi:hypothetical protein